MPIEKMTPEDKAFLDDNFTGCERLCLNECSIKSLDNLPSIQCIHRVSLCANSQLELNDNDLSDEEVLKIGSMT